MYYIIYIYIYLIQALIPDVPLEVKLQTERTEFMNSKVYIYSFI